MNQKTLKNVIIGLLVVIIILLVLLYLHNSKSTSTPSNTNAVVGNMGTASNPTIVRSVPPVILDSPYLYDSGYWVSPDTWWMSPDAGNTYVRNNYKTNYNYYYDKHADGHKPAPTRTTASTATQGMLPQPNPTPSATMGIQNILPTGNLVAPSQDSVFPLPTLATPGVIVPPDAVAINTIQTPVEMSHRQLPELIRNDIPQTLIADSMAAQVDTQASQLLGMRGGNNHLEPPV
jgi:hypothetical protein